MLIVMKTDASRDDIEAVERVVSELGFTSHTIVGAQRVAIVITGNQTSIDPARFENLAGVAELVRVTKQYKLVTREFQSEKTVVRFGDATIGGGKLAIIAGPCAVESHEQTLRIAEAVERSGARFFRGGAFKPRTSPYSFQGLGEEGLQILAEVRERFGLKIITEAVDEQSLELVERYADCIQIGTRNMQNFSLLKRAGRSRLPVMLKRGMAATLDEWLLAAEYVLTAGNSNVILCERGIRTFAQHARGTLDLSIVPAVQRVSHLPVVVDPSHGTGKNYLVAPMARAGVACGADGVMIETHGQPEDALSDGAQSLDLAQYAQLVPSLRAVHEAMHETVAPAVV